MINILRAGGYIDEATALVTAMLEDEKLERRLKDGVDVDGLIEQVAKILCDANEQAVDLIEDNLEGVSNANQ